MLRNATPGATAEPFPVSKCVSKIRLPMWVIPILVGGSYETDINGL